MPEIHIPKLDDHEEPATGAAAPPPAAHRSPAKSALKIGLEVVLITAGVFLGLMGEQWRERMHERELAEAALHRFRSEIVTNRQAVLAVKDYHATVLPRVKAFLRADAEARKGISLQMKGVQPAIFEHSAWDLALATQSLAHIDPELGFAIAKIYSAQEMSMRLTNGLTQAMYLRPPGEDRDAFLWSVDIYFSDIVAVEPELVKLYDAVLPQIDRALGETPDHGQRPAE